MAIHMATLERSDKNYTLECWYEMFGKEKVCMVIVDWMWENDKSFGFDSEEVNKIFGILKKERE